MLSGWIQKTILNDVVELDDFDQMKSFNEIITNSQ
jgi:hypothetical protein